MRNKPGVVIVDYEMGNLFSVKQACECVGLNAFISRDKNDIFNTDGLILPGVGAFGDAMQHLRQFDLVSPIIDFIHSGKPFLGICLGMQLLMAQSEEFGRHQGLNIFPGSVRRFRPTDIIEFPSSKQNSKTPCPPIDKEGRRVASVDSASESFRVGKEKLNNSQRSKVPQVGWNQIFLPAHFSNHHFWETTPFRNLDQGEYMYFVHSYYVEPQDSNTILSMTEYGNIEYCSSLYWKNVLAVQFHPEKSAQKGIQIYRNWASLVHCNKSY